MSRRYGHAAYGDRVPDAVPKNFGRNVTILAAPSCISLDAVMSDDGATETAVFRTYVEQVLVLTLASGDIVVMDNLSIHKVSGIRETTEAAGATLLYLPLYSPDCAPIKSFWSKLKARLRKAKARIHTAFDEALTQAIDHITESDSKGWFQLCGYTLH